MTYGWTDGQTDKQTDGQQASRQAAGRQAGSRQAGRQIATYRPIDRWTGELAGKYIDSLLAEATVKH